MAGKQSFGAMPKPSTYPNKAGGSSGKASIAGKHNRSFGHLAPGFSKASDLSSKNKHHETK